MRNFDVMTCRDLTDYCKREFSFQKNILNQVSDGEVIDWSMFKSKTIKFVVIDQAVLEVRPEICLDGGEIDGDLIVIGSGDLKSFSMVNCAVEEEIKIENLVADKVEVCSNAKVVTLKNCKINDLHICGEIKEFVSIDNCEFNKIEMEGLVDNVFVNNLEADYFDASLFNFELLEINSAEIRDLIIPSAVKVRFNNFSVINFQLTKKESLRRVKNDIS